MFGRVRKRCTSLIVLGIDDGLYLLLHEQIVDSQGCTRATGSVERCPSRIAGIAEGKEFSGAFGDDDENFESFVGGGPIERSRYVPLSW